MKLFFKPFVWFLSALLVLSIWLGPAKASNSLADSRINQLEFQMRSLQNQVSQLQSQLPRASGGSRPAPVTASPAFEPSLDEQFDNLATLVIELSQRVSALEAKVSETPL
ncbi:hypothetical protein [Leptolyngbya sp. BC1307]|uniref:hypothetical protein n=1 Tax=Leptolyngbya sp. BC1307 TaxID=2029589 RepID=UPI000EFB9224|nr:hypothetical protein [Leptolyngbya sp. BC1307]